MINERVRFASGIIIPLAIWQIFSPLILGYTSSMVALWDALAVGVPVLLLGSYRMLHPDGTALLSAINLVLGVWLAASPFALGITSVPAAMWNDITIGIGIAFSALVALAMTDAVPRA